MSGNGLALGLVAVLTLAACAVGADGESPDRVDKLRGAGCAQAVQAASQQADVLADASNEMRALGDSGQLEPGEVQASGADEWWFDGAPQAGPGATRWSALRAQAVEAARLWARVIVNNQTCFPATDVAKAQEWLTHSG